MNNLVKFKIGDKIICKFKHLHIVTFGYYDYSISIQPKCINEDGIEWGILTIEDCPIISSKLAELFYV